MNDIIRRDEALAGVLNHYEVNNEIQNKEMDYIYNMVNNLRAVDAVEVVRCYQCRFYEKEVEYYGGGTKDICRLLQRQMQDDDFCSYGKRRED